MYICISNNANNIKNYIMRLFKKESRIFRNEAIGTDFIFDCDIEIFVSINGEIEDYSGCSFSQANELINRNI